MTWRGMDTEAVEALGSDLRAAGARVEALGARLAARLDDTYWVGQDATRFREDWESRLRPALERADAALSAAAQVADRHVRDQTTASN